jgi:hypothetical protein
MTALSQGRPMKIDNQLMLATKLNKGAEEAIIALGAGDLLTEIREVIFGTKVYINPTKTTSKGKGLAGKTGNKGLTPQINAYLRAGLRAKGWNPYTPTRVSSANAKIDWYKKTPDPYWEKLGGIGVGVETQFGNNFQAYGDIQRLQLAFNTFELGAGLIIVPSDELSLYLADRCANFSNTSAKLRQHFDAMAGARAFHICPIGIIGISQDGFVEKPDLPFALESEWVTEGNLLAEEGKDAEDSGDEIVTI